MSQKCTKCARVNPDEAAYCFHDGAVMPGHSRNGGPVAMGVKPFPGPFVFPSGRSCRNFDELAIACQEEWQSAKELLQEGFLESFLGGLGRIDLASAAKEAAHFPDRDRGLDQFLTKLPSQMLDAPKLRVEPLEVNLGVLPAGQDRKLTLRLENQGGRLLYGSVAADETPWLTLGDAPGAPQKLFQFGHDLSIPVHVRGKQLRASHKPIEGRLVVESNGGTATVLVRAEVPVKPYPDGPLAGAKSPRQVAEKAKLAVDRSRAGNKKEAAEVARFFEKGRVAEWYKSNGWVYPVQGPSASGLGAVQQYFEALGLTPPPKVEISEKTVKLFGNPGQNLRHTLEVSTPEKRPVYAHGASNEPWVEVSRAKLNGRVATISLVIPSVPNREGETLTARVSIRANGNQRFVVPVTLTIGGSFDFAAPAPVAAAPAVVAVPAAPEALPEPVLMPRRSRSAGPNWMHLVPAFLLVLALVGVAAYDVFRSVSAPPPGEPGPGIPVVQNPGEPKNVDPWNLGNLKSRDPVLGVQFNSQTQRFGILLLKEKDPKNPDEHKRLTYDPEGRSNNTRIKIDGYDYLFGNVQGTAKWVRDKGNKDLKQVKIPEREGYKSAFFFSLQKVQVTQHIEVVPGETSRLLDTCLVYYVIENQSTVPHTVGFRIMLDTFIGANDGVPFLISGETEFLTTLREFQDQKDIPDYIEAYETQDLKNPGTVARMQLKGIHLPGVELDPIERMYVCRWPRNDNAPFELKERGPLQAMNDPPDAPKDSCVVLYWPTQNLNPGEKRHLAFTYGLNKLAISPSAGTTGTGKEGQLGLTAREAVRPGEEFPVTAYVTSTEADLKVKLSLPGGLRFAEGQQAEKPVPEGKGFRPVSWKVVAGGEAGTFDLKASLGAIEAVRKLRVKNSSLFD